MVSVIVASLPYLAVAAAFAHSQSATDQRRALELLAGSAKQGCTEAFLLAHGFTVELLTDMVQAGLATAQIERSRVGGQTRMHH